MKNLLSRLTTSALDLVFPLQCAGCQREGRLLCAACVEALAGLSPSYCTICAEPNTLPTCRWCRDSRPDFDGLRAPFLMKGALRQAVHSL